MKRNFTKPIWLTVLLSLFTISALAQPSGYDYGKQLLVSSTQVAGSTNFTDFVMLVNFIDADLRTTANGGQVNNANGFDIVFTLGDCNTLLDHQIEKYVATTGEYIAWVKIPTLLAASNTNIHMYYGNSSITTDPSLTSVWGAEYAAVYHMNQTPAGTSPQLIDYTANTNDGASSGSMTDADLVAGQIGDAIDFDGSNDFFDCGADASTDISNDLTVTAWMYSTSASGHIINRGGGWDDPGYSMFLLSNDIRYELQNGSEKDIVDNGVTINAWRYIAITYDFSTSTMSCIIDGVLQGNTGNFTGPIGTPVENLNIGRKEQNAFYFDGIIDEGRVISETRSTDWLTTEYNNQNSPSTFYTKSAEYSASNLCWTLPVELINFSVTPVGRSAALISWTTKSEINNDYFTVEKSLNAKTWSKIATIKGAGNSAQEINYELMDRQNFESIAYYRLLQTDYDGTTSESDIISVRFNTQNTDILYPNPATNSVFVHVNMSDKIKLYNVAGQVLLELDSKTGSQIEIDISHLPSGTYFIQSGFKTEKLIKY